MFYLFHITNFIISYSFSFQFDKLNVDLESESDVGEDTRGNNRILEQVLPHVLWTQCTMPMVYKRYIGLSS